MRTLNTREDFLKNFDSLGKVISPFEVRGDITLEPGDDVKSLSGVIVAQGATIRGLHNLTTLDGVKLCKYARLYNLDNVVVNPVNITEAELAILRKIPIDSLDMVQWGVGSDAHTLMVWAQVIAGLKPDSNTAYDDGRMLLPSMQWYFHASTRAVKEYLRSIQG